MEKWLKIVWVVFEWICNIIGFLFIIHYTIKSINTHKALLENLVSHIKLLTGGI